MTDKQTMLALAERVEKAEGADNALNADVLCAIGWTSQEGRVFDPFGEPRGFVPDLLGSLDGAVTLVPDECLFTARTVWDKMKPAGLGFVSRYEKGEFGGHERLYWMDEHQAVAATPALALCAAALRARAGAMG